MKKRIDLYLVPHVEVRIHVSEKMVEDYKKCKRITENSDFEECAECNECSWNCTMFQGISACELVTPEQILIDRDEDATHVKRRKKRIQRGWCR